MPTHDPVAALCVALRHTSVRRKLSALFLAFALLVSASVSATFWALETQQQDALIVNLAGRQRMLIQLLSRLALADEHVAGWDRLSERQAVRAVFAATLDALRDGGAAPDLQGRHVILPPARDPALVRQLDQMRQTWLEFQPALERLALSAPQSAARAAALQEVEAQAARLAQQADIIVLRYEANATQKIAGLRGLQIAFFSGALLLLLVSAWLTHISVLKPLVALQSAARRIGGGDLQTPVAAGGPQEIAALGRTLNDMRSQLQSSQSDLAQWAATLEQRVAQRTRMLDALYDVSQEISAHLDLAQVLQLVSDKARELLEADVAVLCLLQDEGRTLRMGGRSGTDQAIVKREAWARSAALQGILEQCSAVRCGAGECAEFCGILAVQHRASHLVAPLRAGGRVIGALCVGSAQAHSFNEVDERLLAKLANAAASALQNARLVAEMERAAILEERQRITAEMHDGLVQTLSYLVHQVERAAEQAAGDHNQALAANLTGATATLRRAVQEVRQSISRLESAPQAQSLTLRLRELVTEQQLDAAHDGPVIEWETTLTEPLVMPAEETEHVWRVTREALLNARRHAQAQRISVQLTRCHDQAQVTVTDDGRGFDPRPPATANGHFGLSIMRARAARLGGALDIETAPNRGTRVTIRWPLSPATHNGHQPAPVAENGDVKRACSKEMH